MKTLVTIYPSQKEENKKYTYRFFTDSGHGWLAVKRNELIKLGILNSISRFSFQSKSGKTVYLEEDCDATKFLQAKGIDRFHFLGNIIESYNDRSPIRSLPQFNQE